MRLGMTVTVIILAFLINPAEARHREHHHRHHSHRHAVHTYGNLAQGLGAGLAHMLDSMGRVKGLQPNFLDKLKQAFADNPARCIVESGYRSHAEQAALHRAKPGLAAQPGHSNHERGLAADLHCERGGLAWLHAHARKYGLQFPMSYEAWHIELIGATRWAHHRRRSHYATAG